jgi:2-haloacid dehalogenase
MKKRLKALVFDAYGTLFDVHSVIATCEQVFPGQGAALSRAWRAKQLEYTWLRSLMGRYEDFWQVTEAALVFAARSVGLRCDAAARQRLMEAYLHLEPFPEVKPALEEVSDYTLAILSNGSPRMLKAAVESAGVARSFKHVISVDEVKIFKPSPRVYELAPRKTDVAAHDIGFVSSNFWDVAGAKSFGFWTCWVNRGQAPEDELGFVADLTVSTLSGLAEALARKSEKAGQERAG